MCTLMLLLYNQRLDNRVLSVHNASKQVHISFIVVACFLFVITLSLLVIYVQFLNLYNCNTIARPADLDH